MKGAGAIEAPTRPIAKDPITLAGTVYVSAIGQTSVTNIKHAMDLYHAENDGKYPKDYPEFMEQIIRKNNIALPTLPYYQEYAYDAPNHKLIILRAGLRGLVGRVRSADASIRGRPRSRRGTDARSAEAAGSPAPRTGPCSR